MRSYSVQVATAVVVANMVGTGVFTSLGFQLLEIESTGVILWLWVLGGVCALCGALCYAELGAHHTASGGEYHFLTELIHPYAGFLSGCVSATIKAISTSPVIDEIDAEVKNAVLSRTYNTVTKAQPTISALGKSL